MPLTVRSNVLEQFFFKIHGLGCDGGGIQIVEGFFLILPCRLLTNRKISIVYGKRSHDYNNHCHDMRIS